MGTRVLVAGIGNIFLGDDGFGPEVVRRLPTASAQDQRIVDYGIRGLHLAFDLLDGWDALVLVDALPNTGEPGRVQIMRAEPESDATTPMDGHAMNPEAVFAAVRALGGVVPPTVVVGCQVDSVAEGIGLSAAVAAAVDPAAAAVARVAAQLCAGQEV
ncbi:hydrogenase maturation protease [Nocardia sp. CA-084685]|uniref:hydrogenase maturation protease n=1 Tax=Nocardia sp. CA-084685 TaxID=3239970 RepID=UPI003D9920A3